MFKPLSLIDLGQIEDDELAKNGTADLLEMLLKRSGGRIFINDFHALHIEVERRSTAQKS
jgi:hypothetical protein